ncbi:hypothetical protein Tco_0715795, partial [Tanacetum coccineum]
VWILQKLQENGQSRTNTDTGKEREYKSRENAIKVFMASFNYRLNPLYAIKECSSCGALYTADFCCSKGGLEGKILVPKPPQNCATCGNPVEGLYCRPCAFVRKCLNEGWYTIHDKNDILNTSESSNHNTNVLMEQMTSICDMVGQYMQKKEEDRRIAEDQAAKDQYWKIPICYDDDEDDTITDEVIKSSVENLVPIPSESEGIPDSMCDVPLCNNSTPLEDFKEHSEILVSLEVVENVTPEDGEIEDDILREKLSKINLLIAKIEAINSNPPPSSNLMIKSSSTSLNFFLEETSTFDNSIPESETFCFNLEEISSGSTTTRSDLSLPDYESFNLDDDHIKEKSSGSTTTHADSP